MTDRAPVKGSPLLVSATAMEAAGVAEELESLTPVPFPLGELYRGHLAGRPEHTVYLANLGIAKVNTAAGLGLAVHLLEPCEVIQFGIGGAFVGSFLSIGMLAVATHDIHMDTGLRVGASWHDMQSLGFPLLSKPESLYNAVPTDEKLTRSLANRTGAHPCRFGTSETVSGDFDSAARLHTRFEVGVESMEGAAAAQVCLALEVPFAEIRAISNIVGERDKKAWDIPQAVRRVNRAVLSYLRERD